MGFGNYLAQKRAERASDLGKQAVSRSAIGRAAGQSHTAVAKVERGDHGPSDALLEAVAATLEVDRDEVFAKAGCIPPELRSEIADNPWLFKLLRENCPRRPAADTPAAPVREGNW